ncbi:magnesium transporter [Microbaculum marinum]|uniref:Magnesium transporter n=1 Tax=Microbaculum marinum TaxID=1764581 RepID=A0AAW9RS41_9HYPH
MPDSPTRSDGPSSEPVTDLMATDVVLLSAGLSCGEAIARLAAQDTARGLYHACVVAEDGRFAGLVSLRDCLVVPAATPLADVVTQPVLTLRDTDDARVAARSIVESGHGGAPVLDTGGHVAGFVTTDVASRFLLHEMEESTGKFAGLLGEARDDYLDYTVWTDFLRRAPWILGLAVAGLASGYVVHVYEDALSALVILALYMPMVADTGGNVGTQSASLVTRAISIGDVGVRDGARVLWREARVSLLMAAALFVFAFLKVYLISNSADVPLGLTIGEIGFAIALALAVQVITATLLGAVLPLAAVAARQDPAVISGPALTTIVDLSGLILYFIITGHLLGLPAAVP